MSGTIKTEKYFSTLNFSKTCRICLITTDDLIPILSNNLEIMWFNCFGIEFEDDETLPGNVCLDCKTALIKCYDFKNQFLENEKLLKYHVDSVKTEMSEEASNNAHALLIDHDYSSTIQIEDNVKSTDGSVMLNENELLVILHDANKSSVQLLKATKNKSRSFKCHWCNKSFKKYLSMHNHLFKHVNNKSQKSSVKCRLTNDNNLWFRCHICNKKYRTKFYLKYHIMQHKGQKDFTCSICGRSFLLKQYLNEHLEIHEPGQYSCELCGKTFTRRVTLKRHKQRHNATRKFMCEICSKAFLERAHLKTHMVVHTKERSFVCNVCEKSFGLKGTLTKHMLTHKF